MKIFKDNLNREWKVCVTVEAVKRVRSLCGVNLLDTIKIDKEKVNADLIDQLAEDPVLLVDVIYALCRPRAEELKISDREFGESMTGDTVEAATTALLEELVNFFPEAKRRVLRLILESTDRLRRKANEAIDRILSGGELEKELARMEKDVSASFISSPELSE